MQWISYFYVTAVLRSYVRTVLRYRIRRDNSLAMGLARIIVVALALAEASATEFSFDYTCDDL